MNWYTYTRTGTHGADNVRKEKVKRRTTKKCAKLQLVVCKFKGERKE